MAEKKTSSQSYKKRFDFFCMMKSAVKRFIGNEEGCGLYISSWFVVVNLVDNIRQKQTDHTIKNL